MNRILQQNGVVLAFGAHPDDLEIGAGGLLARLAAEGADVTMAVCAVPNLSAVRAAEAKRGAEIIGAEFFLVFEEKESRVEDIPMHELVRRFDALVNELKPDLVITHSSNDLHWDHGLVNRATLSALRRTPCDLLSFMSSPENNAQARCMGQCFADITSSIDKKLAAIAAHESQMKHFDMSTTKDLARAMGRISGVEFAEVYEVLRCRV